MLTIPCSQAVVEGNDHHWAIMFLYGDVHAHDFRMRLDRQSVESLRESCELYLKRTADLVTDPMELARSRFDEVAAPGIDPDAL